MDPLDQAVREILDFADHDAKPVVGGSRELIQPAGLCDSRVDVRIHCAPDVLLLELLQKIHALRRSCRPHHQVGNGDGLTGRRGRQIHRRDGLGGSKLFFVSKDDDIGSGLLLGGASGDNLLGNRSG